MKRIIILGAPGSGKGTQAQLLSKSLCIPFISAGEILRQEIKKNEKTRSYIKNTINQGKLVKSSFMIQLIKENIQKKNSFNGFILDGFPRTIEQAKSLKKYIAIEYAIYLNIEYKDIINRIEGRLIHKPSGRTYHSIFNPPKQHNVDDITGEILSKRKDDTKKIIKTRFEEYIKHTQPLIHWFQKEKKKIHYLEIEANQSINHIHKKIINHLNKKKKYK
ncbi:adenylate kinase family protein [Buchnera aphidicola]|uniref:adenylate kinase family protein n=1 Tax=Buchnera aphidicola TaxID=9 RepID=UPI00094DE566|nr:nucleoside monophosphate kinase [Buchnera aphidicola]